MAQQGLWERFKHQVTTAISDVREKVVEEGWFGRPTAPQEESMAVKLGWEQRGPKPDVAGANTNMPASVSLNIPPAVATDVTRAAAALKPLSWEEIRSDMLDAPQYSPVVSPALGHRGEEQGLDR